MIVVRSSVIVMSALVLVALASCATMHNNMMTSAGRLERTADAFASDTRGYFRHAPEFTDQAHDFRETVDRAGDREVILAYKQLWRSYQALRDEVERSDNRQAQVDVKPVTRAFRDIVLDISGYADADSALYARGGYQHDPYYDP
jgi:isopenicillin N synthase-like dioxygenase